MHVGEGEVRDFGGAAEENGEADKEADKLADLMGKVSSTGS
jgi:hypothetical protein